MIIGRIMILWFIHSAVYAMNCSSHVSKIAVTIADVAKKEGCSCVHVVNFDDSNIFTYLELVKYMASVNVFSNVCFVQNLERLKVSTCVYPLFVILSSSHIGKVSLSKDMSRSAWLIIDSTALSPQHLFNDTDVAFDAVVLIAKQTEIFSVYRVAKGFPVRVKKYSLSSTYSLATERAKRSDLEGFMFRTGTVFGEPSTSDGEEDVVQAVWKILQPFMNFSNIHERDIGFAGAKINGSWNGMIGNVLADKHDAIIVDFNITPERLDILDIPHSLLTSRYQVYFRQKDLEFGYAALVKPLHVYVWTAIVVWIFTGALLVLAACKCLLFFEFETEPKCWKQMGFFESAFFILQALSSQGSSHVPKAPSLRIIFFLCYMVAAVIVPSYSASLVSSLTQRSPEMPFKFLEDILNTKYTLMVHQHNADYDFFTTSKNEIYQKITKEKLAPRVLGEGKTFNPAKYVIKSLCTENNLAVIVVEHHMEYNIHYINHNDKYCRLQKLGQLLPVVHQSMAFKKGCPFLVSFNQKFLQLQEFGILNRERLRYYKRSTVKPPKAAYDEIKFSDVSPIFILYSIGAIVSLLLLI